MKSLENQDAMFEKQIKKTYTANIDWNNYDFHEWHRLCRYAQHGNLLQSYAYGQTMAKLNNQSVRRGIITLNGQRAGVVQVLDAGLMRNMIHGVILDRGPLWFDGYGGIEHFEAFIETFSKEFPKRFGRRIRFIPSFENTSEAQKCLHEYGFTPVGSDGYQTIWLDLRPDLETLRANFKKKWRNALSQAERSGLEITWSDEGKNFSWLMSNYERDKRNKKYEGASLKTLVALSSNFSYEKNMLIGTALLDKKPIASILLFTHGRGATYQIGYTSDTGRDKRAHHLLLWSAIPELKERAIYDFDLGGLNEKDAKGIKNFKAGMGGEIHETLGMYR